MPSGAESPIDPLVSAGSASGSEEFWISAIDQTWTDARRGRELPVRIRWPDGDGPWPLLLFSHGLGGSRDGGEVWGRAWRDAGFVVIHLSTGGLYLILFAAHLIISRQAVARRKDAAALAAAEGLANDGWMRERRGARAEAAPAGRIT